MRCELCKGRLEAGTPVEIVAGEFGVGGVAHIRCTKQSRLSDGFLPANDP